MADVSFKDLYQFSDANLEHNFPIWILVQVFLCNAICNLHISISDQNVLILAFPMLDGTKKLSVPCCK